MRGLIRRMKAAIVARPWALTGLAAIHAATRGCAIVRRADRYVVKKGRREIHLALRHGVYLFEAAGRFERCFGAVRPERIGDAEVADFSTPKVHHVPWLGADLLYTSLGEEKADVEAYLRRLAPAGGDVVLDIGAYCGATACAFSQAVGPGGRVIVVEADPMNYRALTANIERLGLANVEPVHAAVWRSSGTLGFAAEGALGSAATVVGPRDADSVEVAALSLDDLCERLDLRRVDHVKMDIEGAEYEVLPASRGFFERFRPKVVLEIHKTPGGIVDLPGVRRFFEDLGYVVERDIDNLVYGRPG